MDGPWRVWIAGGGIGGLTAAAALARIGCEVRVFERVEELRAVGAGLTLQPNAIAALRTIGLADSVIAAGERGRLARIRRPDGRGLQELDLGFWPGEPAIALHRATLQQLLAAALPPGVLRLGAAVTGWEEPPGGGVRLLLDDGETEEGDLLIGADGIRSALRRQLLGDGEPLYAGYTCWRGVCPGRGLGQRGVSETWGRGRRFGLVPIDGERVYWFAVADAPPGGGDQPGRVHAELRRRFADWHEPIGSAIAATPEAAILRGDILYRQPSPRWGRGAMTLLGDAAHPMTPDLGQGACQAIEDAVVLAACLQEAHAEATSPQAALRRYEALRQPRTAAVVRAAARVGAMAQWRHPWAAGLRDFLNRHVPRPLVERQISSLWSFPGPAPREG